MRVPRPLAGPLAGLLLALACPPAEAARVEADPPVVDHPGALLQSTGQPVAGRNSSAPDSFPLFGGPATLEGKFETAGGLPDLQGWQGVDNTMRPNYWRVSDFHASNLGGHGPGNLAAWCGRTAAEEPGWVAAPGYGNGWNMVLMWESDPVANPAAGQVVDLEFFLNLDTEPGYDNLLVEYDKGGSWTQVYQGNGYQGDSAGVFLPPGARFTDLQQAPIQYDGNDYGGPQGDRIRIRLRAQSDGAWSDQDGLWPTNGHTQFDDVSVTWSDGSSFHDFEDGTLGPWVPQYAPFAGDFAKVFQRMTDLDPCAENPTPFAAFIDDGRPVGNSAEALALYGTDSTGGITSPNWNYGVPGGYVVNYLGGLSSASGGISLDNELWSPPIAWDLPGSADDGPGTVGLNLAFDVYRHLPLENAIYYNWAIRSIRPGDADWGPWKKRTSAYYSDNRDWYRFEQEVGDLVQEGASWVQLRLAVLDWSHLILYPDYDATPSPAFDNVRLVKHTLGGPVLTTRPIDLFHDAFPASGLADASDDAARSQLDIRVDMARDISTGSLLVPGDSITVDVAAVIPGSTVDAADITMEWVLDLNPLFANVRTAPGGTATIPTGAANGWDQWRGSVVATPSTTSSGAAVSGRYFFDLPDADFLYPGDVLRYYIRATDDSGRTSTLPADITGFDSGYGPNTPYDRGFTVRGLPTILDGGQGGVGHPPVLVVQANGLRGNPERMERMLMETGLIPGISCDLFTERGPASGVSNGIGATAGHGASLAQLGGYDCILYLAEELEGFSISDGTGNGNHDKANDIGLLEDWVGLPGNRYAAFFGDDLATQLASSPAGSGFLANVLGAELIDGDVGPSLQGQLAPAVQPESFLFGSEFIAYGGCPGLPDFDHIRPLAGAGAGHRFLDPQGAPIGGVAASVLHQRTVGPDVKITALFPFGASAMRDDVNATNVPPGFMAGAKLLEELLASFGHQKVIFVGTDLPARLEGATIEPTPFNPSTTVRWATGTPSRNVVRVYDSRGRLVRTLLDEPREPGPQAVAWDGRTASGAMAASGVYLFEVGADGTQVVRKGVLLK